MMTTTWWTLALCCILGLSQAGLSSADAQSASSSSVGDFPITYSVWADSSSCSGTPSATIGEANDQCLTAQRNTNSGNTQDSLRVICSSNNDTSTWQLSAWSSTGGCPATTSADGVVTGTGTQCMTSGHESGSFMVHCGGGSQTFSGITVTTSSTIVRSSAAPSSFHTGLMRVIASAAGLLWFSL